MAGKKNKKKKAKPAGNRLQLTRLIKLAEASRRKGELAAAEQHYIQARQLDPRSYAAAAGLAELYAGASQWAAAVKAWEVAVAIKPTEALAYYQLGSACYQANMLQPAAAAFEAAGKANPKLVEAFRNLAVTRNALGEYLPATKAYARAFQVDRRNEPTRSGLAHLLSLGEVYDSDVVQRDELDLGPILEVLFDDSQHRHQGMAPAAAAILRGRHSAEASLEALARDRLLRRYLERVINIDLHLEGILTRARRELLLLHTQGQLIPLNLACSVAAQCFNNEYLFDTSEEESAALEQLEAQLSGELTPAGIAVSCMYGPAFTKPWAERIINKGFAPELTALLQRTLAEPLVEQQLKQSLPSLKPVTDAISQKVQAQYEQHPFPRWHNISRFNLSLQGAFQEYFPSRELPPLLKPDCQILIAGGGTGQHPISVAAANPGTRVLALDLSSSSLAYAMRKAQELGITNLEFMQGDILDLDGFERQFDHIESMGVLHHMEDPELGWSRLTALLRPGGTMRLGFYSERAREGVVASRRIIAERGIPATDEAMRTFRKELLTQPEHKAILDRVMGLDFFSMSTLRDLIFHAREHRYHLPQLVEMASRQGLEFLGLEVKDRRIMDAYFEINPQDHHAADRQTWDQVEEKHPHIFMGMYNFQLLKPA